MPLHASSTSSTSYPFCLPSLYRASILILLHLGIATTTFTITITIAAAAAAAAAAITLPPEPLLCILCISPLNSKPQAGHLISSLLKLGFFLLIRGNGIMLSNQLKWKDQQKEGKKCQHPGNQSTHRCFRVTMICNGVQLSGGNKIYITLKGILSQSEKQLLVAEPYTQHAWWWQMFRRRSRRVVDVMTHGINGEAMAIEISLANPQHERLSLDRIRVYCSDEAPSTQVEFAADTVLDQNNPQVFLETRKIVRKYGVGSHRRKVRWVVQQVSGFLNDVSTVYFSVYSVTSLLGLMWPGWYSLLYSSHVCTYL